jgi:hypothetical protein
MNERAPGCRRLATGCDSIEARCGVGARSCAIGYEWSMSVADVVAPLVTAALGEQGLIRVTCWDGSTAGALDAPLNLIVHNRRALRRIVWAPNELGFARAYVSGDIDVEGDLIGVMPTSALRRLCRPRGYADLGDRAVVDRAADRDGVGITHATVTARSKASSGYYVRRGPRLLDSDRTFAPPSPSSGAGIAGPSTVVMPTRSHGFPYPAGDTARRSA